MNIIVLAVFLALSVTRVFAPISPVVPTHTLIQPVHSSEDSSTSTVIGLLSWLNRVDSPLNPYDVCRWNAFDHRPGYATFACSWRLASFVRPISYGVCTLRFEVASYDPERASDARDADYAVDVTVRKLPQEAWAGSTESPTTTRVYDSIAAHWIYEAVAYSPDHDEILVFAPEVNAARAASRSAGPKRVSRDLARDLAEHLAEVPNAELDAVCNRGTDGTVGH